MLATPKRGYTKFGTELTGWVTRQKTPERNPILAGRPIQSIKTGLWLDTRSLIYYVNVKDFGVAGLPEITPVEPDLVNTSVGID